jgi:hypothetical protein
MKKIIGGMVAAAAMVILSAGGASAASFGVSQAPGVTGAESMVVHVESRYCRELNLACRKKEELGERGQGNCRKYREECGHDRCQRLRHDCLNKERTGREGEGLCRQYRHECRGR